MAGLWLTGQTSGRLHTQGARPSFGHRGCRVRNLLSITQHFCASRIFMRVQPLACWLTWLALKDIWIGEQACVQQKVWAKTGGISAVSG